MAVTEPSRHHMVEVLVEHLGEEAAMTLVEHLPPIGWGDVATRQDIEALRRELLGDLHTEVGAVRGEIGAVRGEIGALRAELHTEIGTLRAELHTEIGALRAELADVRGEIHARSAETMRTLVLGFVGALTANTAIILTAIRLTS